MKKFFISLGFLLFILLLSLFGPTELYDFERGIYYGYDLMLEYKLSRAINKVKQTRDLQPIALQKFTDKQIRRACVQSPYATQTLFEELINEKVNGFTETSDHDGYLLWVFFLDGSTSRVRIFMNFWSDDDNYRRGSLHTKKFRCTKNTLALLLRPPSFKFNNKLISDELYFYFNEEN